MVVLLADSVFKITFKALDASFHDVFGIIGLVLFLGGLLASKLFGLNRAGAKIAKFLAVIGAAFFLVTVGLKAGSEHHRAQPTPTPDPSSYAK